MKIIHYTVIGHGPFPMEMLAVDAAYPRDKADVNAILAAPSPDVGVEFYRNIHLGSHSAVPHFDQWRAHGWLVTNIKEVPA